MSAREVKIFTRNCVDRFSTITASHGGDTTKLYDRDRNNVYKTVNAKRDDITASLEIIFKVGTTETEFDISHLFLTNTNIGQYTFQKYVGGVFVDIYSGEIANGQDYLCLQFPVIRTSRIKLLMKTTQPKFNQEKKIGDIIVTRWRRTLTYGPDQYQMNFRQKVSMYEVGDGGLQMAYTRAPGRRCESVSLISGAVW